MSARAVLALLLAVPALARADPPGDARAAVAARDYARAQAVLERHLSTAPDDDASRFLLARVLSWSGSPDRALALYASLLAREPDNADYLFAQGQALVWAGQPDEGVAALERARALAPDYPELADALAQARRAQAAARPAPTDTAGGPRGGEAAPAAARAGNAGIGMTVRHEWLDRGLDDWRAYRVDVASVPRDALGGYGAINHERRFGLADTGVEAGLVVPFGRGWSVQVEAGAAPGADFLPRGYADLRVQRVLANGWLVATSVRHSAYRDTDVDRLALGVERYVGSWRAGYTLNLTDAEGTRLVGHDVAIDRYYGQRSQVGLRLATGEDTGTSAAGAQGPDVITSDVDAAYLQGRHWLGPRWALQWSAGALRQGDLYRRQAVQLGLWRSW